MGWVLISDVTGTPHTACAWRLQGHPIESWPPYYGPLCHVAPSSLRFLQQPMSGYARGFTHGTIVVEE